MCRRVVMVPFEVVEEIIKDIELRRVPSLSQEWVSSGASAYPGAELSLIVSECGQLLPKTMTWGYLVPWSQNLVFNTRFETATQPDHTMWKESLAQRRCILPTLGFYESHQSEMYAHPRSGRASKQQYLFTQPDSSLLYLAGVYEEGRFSLMTTEPTSVMRPIHNRMPVVLEPSELHTWLQGDYLSLADRSKVELMATREEQRQAQIPGLWN